MRFARSAARAWVVTMVMLGSTVHANEGAAQAASDAFGTSLGRESTGLYSAERVRGFSPVDAGNVRLDGLYFDQVWDLPATLLEATRMRVGIAAQGFVFPAPTGIVDQQWRRAGDRMSSTADLFVDHWGGQGVDLAFASPVGHGDFSLTGGWSSARAAYVNGTTSLGHAGGLALWWRPRARTEAMVFAALHHIPYDEIGTVVTSADAAQLPPLPEARRFDGPSWARYRALARNLGATLRHDIDDAWQLRAGVFRSQADDRRGFANLLLDATADGRGQRIVIADPPSLYRADSGELRLTRRLAGDAGVSHRVHLQVTARERLHRSGGGEVIDFGAGTQGETFEPPRPAFAFGPQTRDVVRQHGLGLAVEGRMRTVLEWSAGAQKASYRKRMEAPALPLAQTSSSPWLGYANVAWNASPKLAWYLGTARGLEESGVAPENASNRNEAMPAILTRQLDGGLRWRIDDSLKLVAGYFDVRKPYFNIDATQRFAGLGDVRHQGLEFSLSGDVARSLRVVAGAVWMKPRVQGEGVALGRVGSRPVGQPDRLIKLDLVWRPAAMPGNASLDVGLTHQGRAPATADNAAWLPAFTELNLGLRMNLPFGVGGASSGDDSDSQLRVLLTNAFDARNLELRGAGAYALRRTRLLTVTWSLGW